MCLAEDVPWMQVILPFYGIFMIFVGLTALAAGLIAILRNHERSWLVSLSLLLTPSQRTTEKFQSFETFSTNRNSQVNIFFDLEEAMGW